MGQITGLAEIEISRIDWHKLVEADGPASDIGPALRSLLASTTRGEIEKAYWRLENHIVRQGEIFPAAVASASVLVAALADERPPLVRVYALELLFQILHGYPTAASGVSDVDDLRVQCRNAAREGLWLLLREVRVGEREAAIDVLKELGIDERLDAFMRFDHDASPT